MTDTAAVDREAEAPVSAGADDAEASYFAVLAELFGELDGITEQLRQVDSWYNRRIQLFVMLNELGVSNPKVAAHIDGGSEAVRAALTKHKNAQAAPGPS